MAVRTRWRLSRGFSQGKGPAVVLLLVACLLPAVGLEATSDSQQSLVLPASASQVIQQAFDALAPELTLDSASIQATEVEARLCRGDSTQSCFQIHLGPPLEHCSGTLAGFWCVTYPDGPPEDALQDRIHAALQAETKTTPWKLLLSEEHRSGTSLEPQKPQEAAGESHQSLFWWWWLALGFLAVPFLVGLIWAKLCARIIGRLGVPAAAKLLWPVLLVLPPAVGIALLPLGFWDKAASLILLWLGVTRALLGGRRNFWPGTDAKVLAAIGLTVVLLELGVRWLMPVAPVFPDVRSAKVVADGPFYSDEEACLLLYPEEYPEVYSERTRDVGDQDRVVLHLGDSMFYWWGGVTPEDSTVGVLNKLDRKAKHVSAAVPGTGPEFHWLVEQRWLKKLKPDLVVLHLCVTNDVAELGRPWPCCDDLPLLLKTPTGPRARCEEPRLGSEWDGSLGKAIHVSPAPFPIRVATASSVFARHAAGLFNQVSMASSRTAVGSEYPPTIESLLEIVGRIRQDLDERKIPLVVVLTPFRDALDPNVPDHQQGVINLDYLETAIRDSSVAVVNAQEPFSKAASVFGVESLFLGYIPFDIHLSRMGHRVEAEWLLRVIYDAAGLEDLKSEDFPTATENR